MERDELFQKMIDICKDIFENEDLLLTEASSAADVEEWDSLTHLSLINELEETYHIEFTLDEITGSKNLGELCDALLKHILSKPTC